MLEDIAILTGGQVISEDLVSNLKTLNLLILDLVRELKLTKITVLLSVEVVKNLKSKLDVIR